MSVRVRVVLTGFVRRGGHVLGMGVSGVDLGRLGVLLETIEYDRSLQALPTV